MRLGLVLFFSSAIIFLGQGLITRDDQNALESSAMGGDVVIYTAFTVVMRSQDLDYLLALFKDIASNRRDNPQVLQYSLINVVPLCTVPIVMSTFMEARSVDVIGSWRKAEVGVEYVGGSCKS